MNHFVQEIQSQKRIIKPLKGGVRKTARIFEKKLSRKAIYLAGNLLMFKYLNIQLLKIRERMFIISY